MRDRVLVGGWAGLLAIVMLAPALGPGYVLSYDMVWVPDLALRHDTLGLGSGLPRAVPSDAVVAVLDEVLGGMLLQKVVLLGSLLGGGIGAARLVPSGSLVAQLAVVTVWIWNPFVVERLVIGHWPVLLGYAVLPWVIGAAIRFRQTGGAPFGLFILLPLGSLSAGAGMATAAALVAFGVSRARRRNLVLGGLLAATNAPWVISGLLRWGATTTDPDGAAAFALSDEGGIPAPLAALGLGGIWNAEVVPDSRTGALAAVWLAGLTLLVLVGLRRWWESSDRRIRVGLVVCWVLGWGLAVSTWLFAGVLEQVYATVPGAGLLRDGSRFLGLCAPLLVSVVACGVETLLDRLPTGAPQWSLAVAVVLFPVAVLPDAAWGVSGRLEAASYPPAYDDLRAAVGRPTADALVLPFSSYRAPGWNEGRKVLDPLGRYLAVETLTNDDLVVSGVTIAGEDQRAAEVQEALRAATPEARARKLSSLGVGLVIVDGAARGSSPRVAGDLTFAGDGLRAVRLSEVDVRTPPDHWYWAMGAAWSAFVGLVLVGGLGVLKRSLRR